MTFNHEPKNLSNMHVDYLDVTRHWHPESEKYSSGDALLTALYSGWELSPVCYREEHWHAGVRVVHVYHFNLMLDGQTRTIPVVNNPYVERLATAMEIENIGAVQIPLLR